MRLVRSTRVVEARVGSGKYWRKSGSGMEMWGRRGWQAESKKPFNSMFNIVSINVPANTEVKTHQMTY